MIINVDENPISFTKSKLPYGWLGNMSPWPVTDGTGVEWRTAEHLFQALRFDDKTIQSTIGREKSPMSAKFVAKANAGRMVIKPRSAEDVDIMLGVLRLKIGQHPELREKLLETGGRQIIEDVTARGAGGSNLFWGMILTGDQWIGENTLGNLWRQVRREIG